MGLTTRVLAFSRITSLPTPTTLYSSEILHEDLLGESVVFCDITSGIRV